jgi:hypothetical protein
MIYDSNRDAFISPKPFNSWLLNEQTCLWESPVLYPITRIQNIIDEYGNLINDLYKWNEEILNWELING